MFGDKALLRGRVLNFEAKSSNAVVISGEVIARLFCPFYTCKITKYIVKKIIMSSTYYARLLLINDRLSEYG